MAELSKYITSESVVMNRSEIHFADYNPRKIDEEAKKTLKRGIKKFGMVGGFVVNKQTGNTLVGGHQRMAVLDDLHKFPENDYQVRVDLIDVDEKSEKELCVLLNNPNAQGLWDFDQLAELIPDIDYKSAGLTEADLNMIGVDYLLQTEAENSLADELAAMMAPANEAHQAEVEMRAEQRAMDKEAQAALREQIEANQEKSNEEQAAEMAAKVQHMKDVKQQVREQAIEKAQDMDAYLMLSFDTFDNKAAFLQRFGHDPYTKVLKGELFDEQVEVIYD